MWTLDQKKLHNVKGDFTLGSVLTYQGKVRSGKKWARSWNRLPPGNHLRGKFSTVILLYFS